MSGLDLVALRAARAKMTTGLWRYCGASDGPCSCGLVWSIDADRVVACVKVRAEWAGDDGVNNLGDGPGIAALVNAADELIAATEERDRLRALLHGLHDAASEVVAGWSEGGCLVSPPCRACRWCIFERTVESVRAALKEKP